MFWTFFSQTHWCQCPNTTAQHLSFLLYLQFNWRKFIVVFNFWVSPILKVFKMFIYWGTLYSQKENLRIKIKAHFLTIESTKYLFTITNFYDDSCHCLNAQYIEVQHHLKDEYSAYEFAKLSSVSLCRDTSDRKTWALCHTLGECAYLGSPCTYRICRSDICDDFHWLFSMSSILQLLGSSNLR